MRWGSPFQAPIPCRRKQNKERKAHTIDSIISRVCVCVCVLITWVIVAYITGNSKFIGLQESFYCYDQSQESCCYISIASCDWLLSYHIRHLKERGRRPSLLSSTSRYPKISLCRVLGSIVMPFSYWFDVSLECIFFLYFLSPKILQLDSLCWWYFNLSLISLGWLNWTALQSVWP
jgi:hypothetical protein